MVKTYLRYAQKRVFGVINSPTCNVVVGGDGSVAITGALADVTVWHLRRGELVRPAAGAVSHAKVVQSKRCHSPRAGFSGLFGVWAGAVRGALMCVAVLCVLLINSYGGFKCRTRCLMLP